MSKSPKSIPGLSGPWQDFFLSIIVIIIFPLIPILLEWWIAGKVGYQTILIATSMYSFSIGFASENRALQGFSLLVGLTFAVLYGVALAPLIANTATTEVVGSYRMAVFAIVVMAIAHIGERYNSHVVAGNAFRIFR